MTSDLGRHADGALVIALLAPPGLIALLMALGLFGESVLVTGATFGSRWIQLSIVRSERSNGMFDPCAGAACTRD